MNILPDSNTCTCEGCTPYGESGGPLIDLATGHAEQPGAAKRIRTALRGPSLTELRRLENRLITAQTSLRADCETLREFAYRWDSRELVVAAVAVFDAIQLTHFARCHVTDARAVKR